METAALQPSSQQQASTITSASFEQAECSDCQGTGWAMRDAEPCLVIACWSGRFRAAMPERYWPANLNDFQGAAFECVMDWIRNPSDGLFITGPCGTGKTHLACAIVRNLMESSKSVTLKRSAEFYASVREMFKPNPSERNRR